MRLDGVLIDPDPETNGTMTGVSVLGHSGYSAGLGGKCVFLIN